MIQVCHIYGELYFCYYYISSTSDHRAFHPRGWGPLHTYVHSFFGFPSHLDHRRSTTKQSSLCYAVGSQEAFHLKNSPVISRMASRVSEESSGLRWYFGLGWILSRGATWEALVLVCISVIISDVEYLFMCLCYVFGEMSIMASF